MSIEQKINDLLEQAEVLKESADLLTLTEEDLDLLSEEEIAQLIENIDQLDETSKATLAKYVGSTTEFMDKDNAAEGTKKVRAKSAMQDKSELKNHATEAPAPHGKEYNVKKGASWEQGDRTEVMEEIDLGGLLAAEGLTEEFKEKAATIFEAAVSARVSQEMERIQEELSQRSIEESAELKEGLIEKVDGYLGYVAEQWMNKNELALENGIKAEMFESFINGMKSVFTEHYVNVPEEQLDVLECLQAQIEEMQSQLDETTEHNVQLSATLKEISREIQIEEATDGLSEVQAEKFRALAENLVYEDEESFAHKLDVIRENYFSTSDAASLTESKDTFITDAPVQQLEEDVKTTLTPEMSAYTKAIR